MENAACSKVAVAGGEVTLNIKLGGRGLLDGLFDDCLINERGDVHI